MGTACSGTAAWLQLDRAWVVPLQPAPRGIGTHPSHARCSASPSSESTCVRDASLREVLSCNGSSTRLLGLCEAEADEDCPSPWSIDRSARCSYFAAGLDNSCRRAPTPRICYGEHRTAPEAATGHILAAMAACRLTYLGFVQGSERSMHGSLQCGGWCACEYCTVATVAGYGLQVPGSR